MSKFVKEISKYIKQNATSALPAHFKFEETTIIDPEVVAEIYGYIVQANMLKDLYDKECDYNRLLRKENSELKEELEDAYSFDEEDTIPEPGGLPS